MSYWSDRQEQLKKVAETDEGAIKKRLKKYYDKELRRLDREIAAYFQKYGEDNVIEYRQLMQRLDEADRTLLIEQMDEFAEKYPQYAHLMPVRESIYKLDRLQGLQYSVNIAQANIAGYTEEQIRQYETKLAQKGLNYSMETLGFGKNFYSMNDDIVKSFVGVAWCNGENFSERIWNDTQKVANYINQDMAQAFARGDAYRRIAQDLQRRFGTNYTNAYRLVFTEGTYVMAESSIKPFEEDFEQYEYSPILDGKTCPICRALAGKVFLISERQPGVNFPPMHPWCRCSWEPYVENWDEWIDEYVAKHGGDAVTAGKSTVAAAENIEKRLKNSDKNDIINKRGQYDPYDDEDPKGSDKRALELMRKETGYTLQKCKTVKKDMDDYFGNGYKEYVAGNKPEQTKEVSEALRRMQPYDGTIYRGLEFIRKDQLDDFVNALSEGNKISFDNLQSWSSRENVANRFAAKEDHNNSVVLVCKNNQSGVGVQHISKLGSSEAEVLCPAGTRYRVVRVSSEGKVGHSFVKGEYAVGKLTSEGFIQSQTVTIELEEI